MLFCIEDSLKLLAISHFRHFVFLNPTKSLEFVLFNTDFPAPFTKKFPARFSPAFWYNPAAFQK